MRLIIHAWIISEEFVRMKMHIMICASICFK
jgi:hypothetical protein